MFRALLPAFPDRLPAGTKGMMCQAGFGSLDLARGSYSCFYEALAGGYGGRHASDGPDAVQAHGQNTENAPIEETELNYPVRSRASRSSRTPTGPGRFRGGLGLRKDFRFAAADDVHGARRPRPASARGAPSAGTRARRRVRPHPRRRRDAARLEEHGRPRRRRRGQRPQLRRRRLRAAARSAIPSGCCATCSRGRSAPSGRASEYRVAIADRRRRRDERPSELRRRAA